VIFIDRNQPVDGAIVRPKQKWFDDAATLTAQAKHDGPSHKVTDHYKDVEVKKALEKLFHNKCAYCEGEAASQGPWDVEHYRPKGSVKENSTHSGYYWLAYTWDNLLPSCTFCNQRHVDQPTWDEPVAGPAAGKLDQFPLLDEQDRAMAPDSPLSKEKPALLNPCIDQDCEAYFRYDIQGHILAAESGSPRAERTIGLCHLERRRLRDARADLMVKVIKAVECHELAVSQNNELMVQMTRELVELFTAARSPFAGAARFVDRNRQAFMAV
jgi:uncharacterized protein (TIGR02646 family)